METRVPADEGPWPAAAGQEGDAALARRLAAIERRLDALEGSIREAVSQEVQGAVDELRRAVSDLGRLMLRDLDRLTKVLADHRDAIVDRLQAGLPAGGPVPGEEPSGSAVAAPADGDDGAGAEDGAEQEGSEPAPLTGEEGRWRALPGRRGRRRSPKAAASGDTRDGS